MKINTLLINTIGKVLSLISLAGIIIIGLVETLQKPTPPPPPIEQQIQQLEEMEKGLEELKTFVEDQKVELKENERILNELEKKKEELDPIVSANQETVEAILSTKTKYDRRNAWLEWIMAFFVGVLSSVAATFLITTISNRKNTKQDNVSVIESDNNSEEEPQLTEEE